MVRTKNFILTVFVLSLVGCGSWSPLKWNADSGPVTALDRFSPSQHKLIADNLLSVIAQFDELPPWTTTVQLTHTQTPFGRAVQKSIVEAGYGTQEVEGDLGVNLIRYLAENAETEQGFRTRYRIEIGDLYAERDFHIIENSVAPTSQMRVSSNSNQELKIDDSIFTAGLFDADLTYVTALNAGEPEIRVIEFNRGEFNLDETIADSSSGVFSETPTNQSLAAVNTGSTVTGGVETVTGQGNMYVTGSSNFSRVFEQYEDTLSGILVFANDSLVLGESNKQYLQNLANTFDPESEIFSVIGCSHGKTSVADGNEVLAKGRANRVKDALMVAGVGEEYIYDEGCWASRHFDEVMPRRGVLLTRKKRIDNT